MAEPNVGRLLLSPLNLMRLIKQHDQYVFFCLYEQRHQAQGFRWNPAGKYYYTSNPAIALRCAAWADDELRAALLKEAAQLPDPTKAVLTYKDGVFRFYGPPTYNYLAKNARFRATKEPYWHWWTESLDSALRLYSDAAELAEFEVNPDAKVVLQEEHERRARSLAASTATSASLTVPAPAGLQYRPFQVAGIAYMRERAATLLADQMGLGKTIQVLGLINSRADLQNILLIVPATLKTNWLREFTKWHTGNLTAEIATAKSLPESRVVIINYDILHRHLDRLLARQWDLVVLDEAHFIKSEKARRSRTATALVDAAPMKLMLTGTPLLNRPAELWNLISHLDPQTWGPRQKWPFFLRYCAARKGPFGWDLTGASNLEALQETLRATIMCRRLKSEVLTELPAKQRQVIELPQPPGLRVVTDAQQRWEKLLEWQTELRLRVELAKASDDPQDYKDAVADLRQGTLAAFEEMSKIRHDEALRKLPACLEHLEEAVASSGKVVVFGHHKDVLHAVRDAFGETAVLLTGDSSERERQEAIDRFQSDPGIKVFVGSILAAGLGITLTTASHCVFVELSWRPSDITQAEDRLHRIGQTDSVLVQHLVLEASLDAHMANMIVAKQEIADRALDNPVDTTPFLDVAETAEVELVLPEKAVAVGPTRALDIAYTPPVKLSWIEKRAATLTALDCGVIHSAIRQLANACDGAYVRDGRGFSALDVRLGHSLAARTSLSPKAAALALNVLKKYRHTQLKGETQLEKFYDL